MKGRRTFIPSDNFGPPCHCLICEADGATHLSTVKVPPDETHTRARVLHGRELLDWHAAARERVLTQLRGAGPKPMESQ